MTLPLESQVALVTGGAGLIGAAICRRLAEMGATIAINGRDAAKADGLRDALRSAGHAASTHIADVTDAEAVARMVAEIEAAHGRLDILVNNAGGAARSVGHVEDIAPDRWDAVLALNLTSSYLCCRAALPGMYRRGYGRIVGIGSAGYFGVMGLAGYSAAKAGLIGFTKALALEAAPHGVTANVVVPHLVESPRRPSMPQPMLDALYQPAPIKRHGTPEENAAAVAYFCSPDAGYVTGEVLHVTGGIDWLGPSIDMSRLPR